MVSVGWLSVNVSNDGVVGSIKFEVKHGEAIVYFCLYGKLYAGVLSVDVVEQFFLV